jgi:uncharacterized protein (DUF2267 family)
MSNQGGLKSFNRTVQETKHLIKEVMVELDIDNEQDSYLAFKSVLHALRDRLPPEEAVHFAAQLPMLARGFFYEGWKPSRTPIKVKTKDEFFALVEHYFPEKQDFDIDPEEATYAVFKILSRKISRGEIDDIKSTLPRDLADLWASSTI